jgi:hypothetical protein
MEPFVQHLCRDRSFDNPFEDTRSVDTDDTNGLSASIANEDDDSSDESDGRSDRRDDTSWGFTDFVSDFLRRTRFV